MRYFFLVLVLLLSSVFSFAQDTKDLTPSLEKIQKELEKQISDDNTENKAKEDSLNLLLSKTKDPFQRIEIYLELCFYCELKDNLKYAEPLEKLCLEKLKSTKDKEIKKKLYNYLARTYEFYNYYYRDPQFRNDEKYEHYAREIVNCYRLAADEIKCVNAMLGLADYYGSVKGDILRRLNTLQEGLSYTSKNKNYKAKARIITQLALLYSDQGDTLNAIKYVDLGYENEKRIGDSTRLSRRYILIGVFFTNLGMIDSAMVNFNKAIVRYKRTNELDALAECYLKLGDCYSMKKNNAAAIENYKLSMKYAEESKAYQFFFFSILKIGSIYRETGQINIALDYHNKALQITTNVNMPEPIAVVKLVLAEDYFYNKDYKKARQMAFDANQFFTSNGSLVDLEKSEMFLYKTDSVLGDYKNAFYHYQLYLDAKNKLKSEDFKKVSQSEKFKSDLEKQKLEQKAIQEKRDAKAREDQARQQWIIYSIIAILVLIVAFSFVLFRRYKQINKQNQIIEWQKKLVEEKHKEITDSINYSERIQRSFLASTTLLDKNLKNYFILFKPKDVVSGDFYWADILPNGNFILVTADSTGHGVPGAIMSILNISSLENAVEKGLVNPAEILMHSRSRIIERLKKDGSAEGGKDGMDCSAIVFNPERTKLKFSAAHNPVWIIRENQLIELTPDKMPVAKHDKDHLPFTEKEIDLRKNDLIITLTDGYPDQFGGEKGKKFKYKNLSELLIQLSSLDENAIKSALEQKFDSWKGDLEQVDDVCLIGIRI